MHIRFVNGSDFYSLAPLINEWWGGRDMAAMLPKLFFDHFTNTSFVAKIEGEIVGFLIGFLSPSKVNEAYIHFIGVHPPYRNQQIGTLLYKRFFTVAKQHNRQIVRCVTSPVNKTSIAYHKKMGFDIEEGNKQLDGVDVTTNYDGKGQDRVCFVKQLR
ncbi:GNAT family N-acetyltransferase [Virgibacillus chiguensis]|uniref:GNAT family N-acetyltransferase n=1 Tax=Virgibacillus chiguensis TaxID=411959 RepID=UPI000934DF9A|nr:GNAT family N-acetyltransferase [Virgibacillus chiguensis]